MTIGILGALPQEIALLKLDLTVRGVERIGGREFFKGELYCCDAALALSGIGKVSAASAAAIMLAKFECDSIVFVGVAGGASMRVRVGDIVVANELVQHDFDATPIYPTKFHIPSTNRIALKCDEKLTEKCALAAEQFVEFDFDRDVSAESRAEFGIANPSVHRGLVLSGDKFIDDSSEMKALLKEIAGVLPKSEPLAVEMEGAAVAQVCIEFGAPFAVVRVVSDGADENAIVDFARFVDKVASRFSRGVIKRLFEQM